MQPFTITPFNSEFGLIYDVQVVDTKNPGMIMSPRPSWITFESMKLSFYTKALSDSGIYQIQITATPYNLTDTTIDYHTYQISPFQLTISKQPPPIQVTVPPVFMPPLDILSFYAGDSMLPYKLPPTFDEGDYTVTIKVQTSTIPKWVIYDPEL